MKMNIPAILAGIYILGASAANPLLRIIQAYRQEHGVTFGQMFFLLVSVTVVLPLSSVLFHQYTFKCEPRDFFSTCRFLITSTVGICFPLTLSLDQENRFWHSVVSILGSNADELSHFVSFTTAATLIFMNLIALFVVANSVYALAIRLKISKGSK